MAATFLKACIEVATETEKAIAAAAFITAIIQGEKIRLPLLHSECLSIIKKVSKQQDLSYVLDKVQREIQLTADTNEE